MRFLISFVNSSLALGGFDWETGELFWSVSSDLIDVCGICYNHQSLWVASHSVVRRIAPDGEIVIRLPGPYPALAHSVHAIDQETIGVVDTGNSIVRLYSVSGHHLEDIAPIADWSKVPPDAIHLNDFAVTPHGIVASCFDFRPWRSVRNRFRDHEAWSTAGLGLLLNLQDGNDAGRIIACGLDHPHSVTFESPYLYHCSSATGTLHQWEFGGGGTLVPLRATQITREHFLRGACFMDGSWFLGGSTARHTRPLCNRMAIYRFDETSSAIERKLLPGDGEIYDILPWRDEVMSELIRAHFDATTACQHLNGSDARCSVAAAG